LTFLVYDSRIFTMSMYVTEEELRKNIREVRSDINTIVKDFFAAFKELKEEINDLQETTSLQSEMIRDLKKNE